MASITYPLGEKHTNPYVILTDNDTDSLIRAFDRKKRRVLAREIAQELGVGRPYLYQLLTSKRINLLRFGTLCQVLNIKLLKASQLDSLFTYIKTTVPTH